MSRLFCESARQKSVEEFCERDLYPDSPTRERKKSVDFKLPLSARMGTLNGEHETSPSEGPFVDSPTGNTGFIKKDYAMGDTAQITRRRSLDEKSVIMSGGAGVFMGPPRHSFPTQPNFTGRLGGRRHSFNVSTGNRPSFNESAGAVRGSIVFKSKPPPVSPALPLPSIKGTPDFIVN